MKDSIFNFALAADSRIDAEKGIITGVSVITEGEARGHLYEQKQVMIDSTTLSEVMDCASSYSGGLKVKMNHYSGAESIVGSLRNFNLDGKQLRADLHLLSKHDARDYILELAAEMPDQFGLSISFSGTPRIEGDYAYSTCSEIYSADLVDQPAANMMGLFSVPKVDTSEITTAMANPTPSTDTAADPMAEVLAQIKALSNKLDAFIASDPVDDQKAIDESIAKEAASEMSAKLDTVMSKLSVLEEAGKGASPVATEPVEENLVEKFESLSLKDKIAFARANDKALRAMLPKTESK
jgi:hypothetical protein